MNTSIQLPEAVQKFPFPTLFVVADHERANVWRVFAHQAELLHQIHEPRERKTDHEGGFQGASGTIHAAVDHAEDERLRHYASSVAAAITSSVRTGESQELALIMPADLSRPVLAHLDAPTRKAVTHEIHADLIKQPILDVITRLIEQRPS